MAQPIGSRGRTTTASSQDQDYENDTFDEDVETDEDYVNRVLSDLCHHPGDTDTEFDPSSVPACERLSIRRKTGIELVKDTVQKPNGAVPMVRFPAWNRLSMDKKIPLVPAANRSIIFSRGAIGENLLRKPKHYINDDPLNQERVLTGSYNALHDPYAQNYFSKPSVQKQLIQQGLVTPAGQVVCTLGEFNKFRSYLNSTVYNEDVNTSLDKYNSQIRVFQEQTKKIKKEESITVGKDFKREQKAERARKTNRRLMRDNLNKLKERERIKEERILRWNLTMEQKRLDRQMRADQRERARILVLENIRQRDYEVRVQRVHLIEAKEKAALIRHYHECSMVNARREQQDMEWIEAKIGYQEEQEVKEDLLEISLRRDAQRKAELRQRRIENHRKNLPQIVEVKVKQDQYLVYLLRKYYIKWVTATHLARLRHPDASHQSLFKVTNKMVRTVDELKDESGLEISRKAGKFGDVVLLLVKSRKEHQSEDKDDRDPGRGQGDTTTEPSEKLETEEPSSEPPPPTPKSALKKEVPKVKNDVELLMDDLVDDATEQYVQDLVQATMDALFDEARAQCEEVLKGSELKLILKQGLRVQRPITVDGDHKLSLKREESLATIYVRERSKSNRPTRPTTVEAWLEQNGNRDNSTSRITTRTESRKHPDESIPLEAMHPMEQELPRDLLQGQAEQETINQFYNPYVCPNPERPDTAYSNDSFLSEPPSARESSFESGRLEKFQRSKSDELIKPDMNRPVTRRRPETTKSYKGAEKHRRGGRYTARSERSRRPETAGSDGSGTSSSSSLVLPEKSESVEAIRQEYMKHRQRLNRSCSPQVNYSSDEFLSLQTDEESEGNNALLQIAQEANKLSKTESLTSLSSYPLASEISQSIKSASMGKDDCECVMTRRNMFSSKDSYNSFTDVVYQEMTIIAESKTLVDELIDTLATEQEMTIFNQEFFKKLVGMCLNDDDIKLVHNMCKQKRVSKSARAMKLRKGNRLPFTKAKSALALGTKYSTKVIKETQSGPSMLVSRRKLGPRKFITKPSVVPDQVEEQSLEMETPKLVLEDHLMKGDTLELKADGDHVPPRSAHSDGKGSDSAYQASDEDSPRKFRMHYEPNFKTSAEIGGLVKARESSSEDSNTSEKSYTSVTSGERESSEPALKKPPKLNLKKLTNIRNTKGSFGGNVYKTDEIPYRAQQRQKGRGSLKAAGAKQVKFQEMKPVPEYHQGFRHLNPSNDLVMQLAVNPRLGPIIHHSVYSPRPPSRGNYTSSIPQLPEIPGLRKSLEVQPERRPSPPENVKLPRLVARTPPQQGILTLLRPAKVRAIPKHYVRRGVLRERSPDDLFNAKQEVPSRFSANLQLRPSASIVPSFKLLPTTPAFYIPGMDTVDEILLLVRTIALYKTTQKVLYVVSNTQLKEPKVDEEMQAIIEKVAIKSIVKISMPLAEISEQRKYPQRIELALESYRIRVDELSQCIASLILASFSRN